jgi:hypothetical protein
LHVLHVSRGLANAAHELRGAFTRQRQRGALLAPNAKNGLASSAPPRKL